MLQIFKHLKNRFLRFKSPEKNFNVPKMLFLNPIFSKQEAMDGDSLQRVAKAASVTAKKKNITLFLPWFFASVDTQITGCRQAARLASMMSKVKQQ